MPLEFYKKSQLGVLLLNFIKLFFLQLFLEKWINEFFSGQTWTNLGQLFGALKFKKSFHGGASNENFFENLFFL